MSFGFVLLAAVALLPLAAWRFGVDSRDGSDWTRPPGLPARHGPLHPPANWVPAVESTPCYSPSARPQR